MGHFIVMMLFADVKSMGKIRHVDKCFIVVYKTAVSQLLQFSFHQQEFK